MRMRGTVRLCDEGGCGFRWRECPTHTPIIAYGIASGLAENFEKRGTCKECGYQLHSPTCERGKPKPVQRTGVGKSAASDCIKARLHIKCPTCGFGEAAHGQNNYDCALHLDMLGIAHKVHRAAWLAKQRPAARAGWHKKTWNADAPFPDYGFERDDKRAIVWRREPYGWCSGSRDCQTWKMHMESAEQALDHADAWLAEEDARKQEDRSEPPSGWVVAKASIVGDWWHWHRLSGCDGICCFAAGNDPAGHDRRLGRAEAVAACWAAVDAEKAR